MALTGTRGLIRISQNPSCQFQAAMVADRNVSELVLYKEITGSSYPGDYGERASATKRGIQFERVLSDNDAAKLRRTLTSLYGLDPDRMRVRNLADEVPGGENNVLRAMRLSKTLRILRDLAQDRVVPGLVLWPQLRLPVGDGTFIYVSPDFMVLDASKRIYVPGEIKAYIVRGGVVDQVDRNNARRQGGAEALALRVTAEQFGLANRVTNRAVFVMASPFGLTPRPAQEERLDAEVREIEQVLPIVREMRSGLSRMRRLDQAPLNMLYDELPINYQESCVGGCAFAEMCQARTATITRSLGDEAADILGPDIDIDRIDALLRGATPSTTAEADLTTRLTDSLAILGIDLKGKAA